MRNTYEEIADRDGLTVEQVERIMQLRSENEYLRSLAQEKQTHEKEQQINETVAGWYKQADEMKPQYPDFNLDEWAGNSQFMQLLQSGIDVRTAYEVVNIDNIKANVAKTMEQNVYQNVRAKGQRPVENATKIVPGVVVKASVKDLDAKDRAEIARRVSMGETIKFD
jgi:regulator of replication initiation timing